MGNQQQKKVCSNTNIVGGEKGGWCQQNRPNTGTWPHNMPCTDSYCHPPTTSGVRTQSPLVARWRGRRRRRAGLFTLSGGSCCLWQLKGNTRLVVGRVPGGRQNTSGPARPPPPPLQLLLDLPTSLPRRPTHLPSLSTSCSSQTEAGPTPHRRKPHPGLQNTVLPQY